MLAIRLQRKGRRGHAQFRVIAQDAARSPDSGRVAAYLGHYDPHAKQLVIDQAKIDFYLKNGAQPSPRVISLLKSEKIKLPSWVSEPKPKTRTIKNPDKLRKTRPQETSAAASEDKQEDKEPKQATDQEAGSQPEAQDKPQADAKNQEDEGNSDNKDNQTAKPKDTKKQEENTKQETKTKNSS